MEEYGVSMSNGEVVYILAPDLEQACWDAFELSKEMNTKLKDVVPTYVKKEKVFSKQLDTNSNRTP